MPLRTSPNDPEQIMKRTRIPAVALAVLLAVTALAGCGSSGNDVSDLPVKQLLTKAKAQLKNTQYLEIKGNLHEGSSSIGLDLSYVGKDSHGTLSVSGKSVEIETVDGTTYFKPSDSFWKAQLGPGAKTVINLINGRWIVASADNPSLSQLTQLTDRSALAKQILSPDSKVTKGKTKQVDGDEAIALNSKNGTLYLATADARPVQITGNGNAGTGAVNFNYDKVAAPTAPPKDKTIDLSKLSG